MRLIHAFPILAALVLALAPPPAHATEPPALISFFPGSEAPLILEGNAALLSIRRSGNTTNTVTVSYATADGTATAGIDYTATSGTVDFAPGQTQRDIVVPLSSDAVAEPNKTFTVTLGIAAGNAATTAPSVSTVTIRDDDRPTLLVSGAGCSAAEGEVCTFMLTLTNPSSIPVTFNTRTVDGSARSPNDFTAHGTTARSIPPGQTALAVAVPTTDDVHDELDKAFTLEVLDVVNADTDAASATGVIVDDDDPPTLSIESGGCTVSEGNGGTTCTFLFRVTPWSEKDITFVTNTQDVTATGDVDYDAHRNRAYTIANGRELWNVYVGVFGDTITEADETFTLTASSIVNASPSTVTGTGTIVNDDLQSGLTLENGGCSVTEGDAAPVSCNFVLRVTPVSATPVTFTTRTVDNTAVSGVDYTGHGDTARTIPAGQPSLTIAVPVLGDLRDEDDKQFLFEVRNVVGAGTIGLVGGTGTILDNDPVPGIAVTGCSAAEGDVGMSGCLVQVNLSAASGRAVSVNWANAPSDVPVVAESFEAPALSAGEVRTLGAGQVLGPWTVASGSVDLVDVQVWQAAAGTQSMDLSGTGAGSIYADVPVASGQPYRVHFALAANYGCGSAPVKQVRVSWNGVQIGVVSADATGHSGTDMGWQRHELAAPAAPNATARLSFTSLDGSACGPVIDEVGVVRRGYALYPRDMPIAGGSFTFGPGETQITFMAEVRGDTDPEGNEVFGIGLHGGANHGALTGATITVIDDDPLVDTVFASGFE